MRHLVVAGGETSGAVVQALGVRQLRDRRADRPRRAVDGRALAVRAGDGWLHLALKSGNFGTHDFFSKAFEQQEPLA